MINSIEQNFLNVREVRRLDGGNIELHLMFPLQARRLRPGMDFHMPFKFSWFVRDLVTKNKTVGTLTVVASDTERGVVELGPRT